MSGKKEIKLTPAGFLEVQEELSKLREEDRPRIINAIKEARAQGDLSENADYDAARDEQAKVEARIQELEYMVEHATIVEKVEKGIVGLGSTLKMMRQMNTKSLVLLKLILLQIKYQTNLL